MDNNLNYYIKIIENNKDFYKYDKREAMKNIQKKLKKLSVVNKYGVRTDDIASLHAILNKIKDLPVVSLESDRDVINAYKDKQSFIMTSKDIDIKKTFDLRKVNDIDMLVCIEGEATIIIEVDIFNIMAVKSVEGIPLAYRTNRDYMNKLYNFIHEYKHNIDFNNSSIDSYINLI